MAIEFVHGALERGLPGVESGRLGRQLLLAGALAAGGWLALNRAELKGQLRQQGQRLAELEETVAELHEDLEYQSEAADTWRDAACKDHLTNVGSRLALEDGLRRHIDRAEAAARDGKDAQAAAFGLTMGDLSHFKLVNDELSHTYGDLMLILTARFFEQHARDNDEIARIKGEADVSRFGGDEFAIIVDLAAPQPAKTSGDEKRTSDLSPGERLERVVQRYQQVYQQWEPIANYNQGLKPAERLGLKLKSVLYQPGMNADDMIQAADPKSQTSKAEGFDFQTPTPQLIAVLKRAVEERNAKRALAAETRTD